MEAHQGEAGGEQVIVRSRQADEAIGRGLLSSRLRTVSCVMTVGTEDGALAGELSSSAYEGGWRQ